jgi:hypothetical protein
VHARDSSTSDSRGIPDRPGTHRIGLEVAAAAEDAGFAIDIGAGATASFRRRTGPSIGRVYVVHVTAAQRLHGARQAPGGLTRPRAKCGIFYFARRVYTVELDRPNNWEDYATPRIVLRRYFACWQPFS